MTAARALEFAPLQQPQRDYTSDREVIRCADGLRFILRTVERDACGVAQAVLFTAWEPADANPYSMKRAGPGGKMWGRADTRTWDGSPVGHWDEDIYNSLPRPTTPAGYREVAS